MSEKTNVEEPKLCVRLEKCKLEGCAGSEEENDTCNCLDSLDIFERCVQDPCSEAWEDLDEDGTECALDDTDGVEEFGIDDNELDPLQEGVECSVGDSKRTRAIGNRRERESESRCANCQKLRRWKTCGSPVDSGEPVLRCSRTNSFMSQLSRQASRQSLPDAVDAQETSPASRSRSRSSFSGGNAIPTHLYCLERFVSSELDSAAELFFKGEQTADELSAVSPVASIASQGSPNPLRAVTSTSSSSLNSPGNAKEAKSPTDTMPTLLSRRKSRMSSIEISLLNSLS